jgi:hypothetical protein
VSKGVALHALAMLAANRYVASAGAFKAYRVTWNPGRPTAEPHP